jgi:succinoglycan biosynthesis transport protein ExoP
VDTEVEIAKSSTVLRRAAEALNLAASPDFSGGSSFMEIVQAMIGAGAPVDRPDPSTLNFTTLAPEAQAEILEKFAKAVSIGRRGLTSVISISATLSSPEAAAAAANAIAEAYLNEQVEARITANESAATALHDRVETLATGIADMDQQIDIFVTDKLEQLGSTEARNLLAKIADEAKKRDQGRLQLADIERGLEADDIALLVQFAEAQQAGITETRQALVRQISEQTDEAQLAAAKLRLDGLDQDIRAAAERQATAIQSEISLSNGLTAAFRSQVETTLSDLELPRDVAVELARLQREADTRRALYEGLLDRLRQVEQQSDFRIPESRIIAPATAPTDPSFPPRRLIVASALFLSLCAGFGLAIVRERFVGGINSIEQLESLINVPVLAAVPKPNGGGKDRPDQQVVTRPLSPYSEAIRRVHHGLNAMLPKGQRALFVTSAVPGDGKTTMALALARQMAMTGSSVLLIDADLRHPSIHRYLNEETTDGLITFLSQPGAAAAEQLAITKEPASGVSFVLGAQSSSIATDALLMSSRFDELMKFAKSNYDVVIVDTPPVGLVVDATVVARHCDLGLFVVRYASTNQHAVSISLRDLTRLEVPICGVLNHVEKAEGYRYGHSRAYRNYYESNAA